MNKKSKRGLIVNTEQLYDEEFPCTPHPTASQVKKLNEHLNEVQKTFKKMKDEKILTTEPSCEEFNAFTEEKKKSKRRLSDDNEETECSRRKKISKVSLPAEQANNEESYEKKKRKDVSSPKLECVAVSSTKKKKQKKQGEDERLETKQDDDNGNEVITKKKKKKKRRKSLDTIDVGTHKDFSKESSFSNDTNNASPKKENKKHKETEIENLSENVAHILKEKKIHNNNIESEESEDEVNLESNSMSREAVGLLKHLKDLYDEYKTKCNLSEVDISFVKRNKKKKKKHKIVKDLEEVVGIDKMEANLQLNEQDNVNNESTKKKSKRKHKIKKEQEDAGSSIASIETEYNETSNSDYKHEERKKKKKHKKADKDNESAGQESNIQEFEYVNIKTELDDSHIYNENENYTLQEIPILNADVKVKKKKKKKNKGEPVNSEEHLNQSENCDKPAQNYDVPKFIEPKRKRKKTKELENENLNNEDNNTNIVERTKDDEFSCKVFKSDDETSDEGVEDDFITYWEREELSDNTFKSLKQLNICLPFIPPPIHNIETRMSSRPTKEQLVKFDNLDVEIVKGKYSKSEDDIIRKNWEELCKSHDIDPDPVPFLNFIHGSSGSRTSLLSSETRRKFVQYLARGLNDRMLWSVYKRFQNLYNNIHKGRFSGNEDKIILDFMKKQEGNLRTFSTLAKMLNRDRIAIEKRHRWLKKVKLLNPNVKRVSKDLKVEIVKQLLEVTNIQDVEDLRHREILPEEWEQVALKVGMTPHGLKTKWKMHLRDRLFLRETDFNDIGKRLVNLIYEDDVDDFRKISFKKYVPHFNSCSNNILYYVFRQLVNCRVPNEYRNSLKGTLQYLKNEYFQMDLRPSNISRIILPDDLRN